MKSLNQKIKVGKFFRKLESQIIRDIKETYKPSREEMIALNEFSLSDKKKIIWLNY